MEQTLDTHINIHNYPIPSNFSHDIITLLSDSPIVSYINCYIVIYGIVHSHIPFTLFLFNKETTFDLPLSKYSSIADIKLWIQHNLLFQNILFKGHLSNKYLFFQIQFEHDSIPSFDKHLFLLPDEIVNHQSSISIPVAHHITDTFISFPDIFLLKNNDLYLPMPVVAFSDYPLQYSTFLSLSNCFVFFPFNYNTSNKYRFAVFNSHYLFSPSYTFFIVKHSKFFTQITI